MEEAMKRVKYTVSTGNPFRYIAAVCALAALFLTLFMIEPTWSTDVMVHSINEKPAPDGYSLRFRLAEQVSAANIVMVVSEISFIVLTLSSFINKRPWLTAIPMLLLSAVPAVSAAERGAEFSLAFMAELAVIALAALTLYGIIRIKIPAIIVTAAYAVLYFAATFRFGIIGINGDLSAPPLMWAGFTLILLAAKRSEE